MVMSVEGIERSMAVNPVEVTELQAVDMPGVVGVQYNELSRPVVIYHRETGEPRVMPRIMAIQALRRRWKRPQDPQRHDKLIFSATQLVPFKQGQVKCLLHPERPEREQYTEWGLPVCEAGHLASPGELVNHMRKRHPTAYSIIQRQEEDERRRLEQKQSRELAQAMLKTIKGRGKKKE